MSSVRNFSRSIRIARAAEDVFAWHERPGALKRLCPPWEKIEAHASAAGVRDGTRVTVRNKIGPWWIEWNVEHRDYVAGRQFRDVQLSGPFSSWEHLHRFVPDGPNACWLIDEIAYRLPLGAAGNAVAGGKVERELSRLFAWRHATTKADLELNAGGPPVVPQRVLIAGASGVIGQALAPFLLTQGHSVVRLVRRRPARQNEVSWNPGAGDLDADLIDGVDAIVNLSGENVAGGRWTARRRESIFRSRVDATRTLAAAVQRMPRKPQVLVNASAVGFYGDRGDEVLTENSGIGQGFLSEVCLAWETHAEGLRKEGLRVALMRFGVVLTPAGGALGKLLPIFRAGFGGTVGPGTQWMSWIGVDDVIGAICHAMRSADVEGPVNVVSPGPVTNREFVRTLAKVLRRPAVVPAPRWGLRALFGEMADATLLASGRAIPEHLVKTGYRFRHPELEGALRHVLGARQRVDQIS